MYFPAEHMAQKSKQRSVHNPAHFLPVWLSTNRHPRKLPDPVFRSSLRSQSAVYAISHTVPAYKFPIRNQTRHCYSDNTSSLLEYNQGDMRHWNPFWLSKDTAIHQSPASQWSEKLSFVLQSSGCPILGRIYFWNLTHSFGYRRT